MKDKDGLILESLYNKVVEEAKTKSKKQVGYLLSNKVSPLTAKQKKKLKKELHSGDVKVKNESSHAIGGSSSDKEIEFDFSKSPNPAHRGVWWVNYDYDARGSHTRQTWDEPSSSDIDVDVQINLIAKQREDGEYDEVYHGENLDQIKQSNPDLYSLVNSLIEYVREREQENEDNYEDDDSYEPEYDKYANDDY